MKSKLTKRLLFLIVIVPIITLVILNGNVKPVQVMTRVLMLVIGLIIILSVKLVIDLFIQQLTMVEDISKKLRKLNDMERNSDEQLDKQLKKDISEALDKLDEMDKEFK